LFDGELVENDKGQDIPNKHCPGEPGELRGHRCDFHIEVRRGAGNN